MKISEIDQNHEKQEVTIEFENENLVEQLSQATQKILSEVSWIQNSKIKNKIEERERFKQKHQNKEEYRPEFTFQKLEDPEKYLKIIQDCINAAENIQEQHLKKYGAKQLKSEELQEFFKEIFRELKLYTKLSANIENEEAWRKNSQQIWKMIDQETFEKSLEKIQSIDNKSSNKKITPKQLEKMFKEEINRLGMEYSVRIEKTSGCYNIPEESTVVVSKGEDGERMYSKEEAEMLTMHEIFHAIRAYNGFKAGKQSGFPKILGLHTPFYDRAEEGGALYRETTTKTTYPKKEFDYHLRLIAAYKIHRSQNYRQDFQKIVNDLMELGADIDRAFYLVARNREALRHHIYQAGRNDWKNIENKDKMLIGKLNEKWADKFQKETNGMIQKPEITADQIFNSSYKN